MDVPAFRYIKPDTAVYLYYAGRDRKYMNQSLLEGRIFLELPGFFANEDTFKSDELMIQGINRSDAAKRYFRDPVNRPRPSAISNYPMSAPLSQGHVDRGFIADLGNVRAMFVDMRVGDIVIMTPSNHYDPLLIGEVSSKWSEEQMMTLAEYQDYSLPYRNIRWLSNGLSRRDFPAVVARRMQNRKAITQVSPEFYDVIFKKIFRAYVWGETSKLDIFAPLYNSNDPTATAEASFLIKYAIAAYSAYIKGEIDIFNDLELEVAAAIYFDPSLVEQIAQAFGSPGGYLTKVIGSTAAIAVAGILAIALTPESSSIESAHDKVAAQVADVQHGNTDDGTPSVEHLIRSIKPHATQKLRTQYGREAKAKLGLTLHGDMPPGSQVTDRVVAEQ